MPFRTVRACMFTIPLALAACSKDTMLLESDVPLPHAMTTVRSADIRRSGGTVGGGTFLLAGDVKDARSSVDLAADRFRAHGWTATAVDGNLDLASARFTKDTRAVVLTLRRRALEPEMSSGSLTVQTAEK